MWSNGTRRTFIVGRPHFDAPRCSPSEGTLPVEWKIGLNRVQTLAFLAGLSLECIKMLFLMSSFSNLDVELFSPKCSVSLSSSQGFRLKADLLWIFAGALVLAILMQYTISQTCPKAWVKLHPLRVNLYKLFNALAVITLPYSPTTS